MLVTHFIFKCLWSFSLWIFPLVLVGQCNSQRRTYFILNDLCYELTELDEKILKATWRGSLNAKWSDLLFNFQTLHEQARGNSTRWWASSCLSEYNRNSSSFYSSTAYFTFYISFFLKPSMWLSKYSFWWCCSWAQLSLCGKWSITGDGREQERTMVITANDCQHTALECYHFNAIS